MRTTLDLPDETFHQLKAQAALCGMKLKELVAQFIERGLAAGANPSPPCASAHRCRWRSGVTPMRRLRRRSLTPSFTPSWTSKTWSNTGA
ncbi:MAG: hypothetical protein WC091_22580 [Sulfuricellaceae bacterium]